MDQRSGCREVRQLVVRVIDQKDFTWVSTHIRFINFNSTAQQVGSPQSHRPVDGWARVGSCSGTSCKKMRRLSHHFLMAAPNCFSMSTSSTYSLEIVQVSF